MLRCLNTSHVSVTAHPKNFLANLGTGLNTSHVSVTVAGHSNISTTKR